MIVPPCVRCGVPLDEIPFEPCPIHQAWEESLPGLTRKEKEFVLKHELLHILYERTGDD